jgi:hypothetical protein
MAGFKDKLQVFFLGLLLGIILGGSFFLLKIDQYLKELSFNLAKTHHTETVTEKTEKKEEEKTDKTQEKPRSFPLTGTRPVNPIPDTSHTVSARLKKDKEHADSIRQADTAIVKTQDEDIVIRKDILLSSRTLELVNISAVANNATAAKDSLAAKMAGVRDDHSSGRQFRLLEFWSSPLNYKGYKMNRNKLVLYGLPDSEGLRLFQLDDEIYLLNGSVAYHLEYGNDFRAYEKVNSEIVVSKLK